MYLLWQNAWQYLRAIFDRGVLHGKHVHVILAALGLAAAIRHELVHRLGRDSGDQVRGHLARGEILAALHIAQRVPWACTRPQQVSITPAGWPWGRGWGWVGVGSVDSTPRISPAHTSHFGTSSPAHPSPAQCKTAQVRTPTHPGVKPHSNSSTSPCNGKHIETKQWAQRVVCTLVSRSSTV